MLRIPRTSPCCLNPSHVRTFHVSLSRKHLVGPPDPVSHLRPVIYDDAPPPPPPQVRHPYSLREFTGDTREYQWKMQRQEIDAFNHEFWQEVRVLLSTPASSAIHTSLNIRVYLSTQNAHARAPLVE